MNIAKYIDHTLLKADATEQQVRKLCEEALEHGFASVCINPVWVRLAADIVKGSGVKVCTVVGFPLGANSRLVKGVAATAFIKWGADEIDMVINIGAVKSGGSEGMSVAQKEIQFVRDSSQGKILKVIIETCLLNREEIISICKAAKNAGADFVKTSTGFGGGGATVEDVALMRANAGPYMSVKASGGIRDLATAKAMVKAGATRLGCSNSVAIVNEERKAAFN